jgi:hypothetical protein
MHLLDCNRFWLREAYMSRTKSGLVGPETEQSVSRQILGLYNTVTSAAWTERAHEAIGEFLHNNPLIILLLVIC